jgi:tetratricopeptide (TPR) repeat protein
MTKQNKYWILILVYIFLVISLDIRLTAQINADSLKSALSTANKSEQLNILNTLSTYYLINSADKALEYCLQAKNIAYELNDNPKKIVALVNTGDAYLNLGNNKQSLTCFDEALGIAKSFSMQKEIAHVSLKIGNFYNLSSVYDKALKYDLEALKIYKTIDDKSGISNTYHNIGLVYYYLGNYDKSLEFTQNALKLREQLNDKPGISKSLNNIAMVYMNLGNNEKALEFYFKALKLKEELNYNSEQSFVLTNIGITYKQMGDYNNALIYFNKSLAMSEKFTNNRSKIILLVCLGTTYLDLKRYKEAESYFEQGLSLSKETDYIDMIALNYKHLANLYMIMGDYKKTLDYKDLFFNIKDSVFSAENQQKITELQVRIENDNTQREAKLIKEKSTLLSSLIISILLALIIIIVVLYSRNKTKKNATKALDKLNLINDEANISIEKLILWSNYQNGSFEFAPKDVNLSEEINISIKLSNTMTKRKKLNITSSTPENMNVFVDPIALNLIIRYLIFNAVKNSDIGDNVTISASQNNQFIEVAFSYSTLSNQTEEITRLFDRNIIEVFSNKEKEPRENLNLALCKKFVEKSGGKIWVETLTDKNASFIFTLPIKS